MSQGRRAVPTAACVRVAAVLLVAACGGGQSGSTGSPPTPAPPPDLRGARVMVLPARAGSPAQLDAELGFWLTQRAPHTTWILPDELQATADRSPAWELQLSALPRPVVDVGGRDLRVADPLYGALRKLGAVENAYVALVPVAVGVVGDPADPALELTAALVDIRGGRVVWLGTVRGGGGGTPAAPAVTDTVGGGAGASVSAVAEALARALVP